MDVAILGTDDAASRFARACLFGTAPIGHTDETTRRDAGETIPDEDHADGAESELTVRLYGSEATAVMDAVDALEDELRDRADTEPADRLERVDGTTDLDTAVGDADVTIETRPDDLETVRHRLAGVEERVEDESVLAIHADVAEPTAAAAALAHPERGIGLSMVTGGRTRENASDRSTDTGVIEVVRADQTDDATVDAVTAFVDRLGWTPVVVHDAPGRLAGRLQLALEVEAMRAVEAGVAAPAGIDAVVETGFGHAAGPLASADRAGLDTRLAELESLAAELGPRFEPPAVLRTKVEAGQLGVKTGSGFREWDDDQPVEGDGSAGT